MLAQQCWVTNPANQHRSEHLFREKPNREYPEGPKDISKDSGFEDEDYFYLDDDYLLLPNAVTLLENKSDDRLHFTYKPGLLFDSSHLKLKTLQ